MNRSNKENASGKAGVHFVGGKAKTTKQNEGYEYHAHHIKNATQDAQDGSLGKEIEESPRLSQHRAAQTLGPLFIHLNLG